MPHFPITLIINFLLSIAWRKSTPDYFSRLLKFNEIGINQIGFLFPIDCINSFKDLFPKEFIISSHQGRYGRFLAVYFDGVVNAREVSCFLFIVDENDLFSSFILLEEEFDGFDWGLLTPSVSQVDNFVVFILLVEDRVQSVLKCIMLWVLIWSIHHYTNEGFFRILWQLISLLEDFTFLFKEIIFLILIFCCQRQVVLSERQKKCVSLFFLQFTQE